MNGVSSPKEDSNDILLALFTLNRRAKRCRDLAQTMYSHRMHGLAGYRKQEKERLYQAKGQALHWLLDDGVLKVNGHHVNDSGLCMEILVGEGYRFHRPCPKIDTAVQIDGEVESKPKGRGEMKIAEAWFWVECYLLGRPNVTVFSWPQRARIDNRICYECGQIGHIAANCPDHEEDDELAYISRYDELDSD